jgi:hypothetical protein
LEARFFTARLARFGAARSATRSEEAVLGAASIFRGAKAGSFVRAEDFGSAVLLSANLTFGFPVFDAPAREFLVVAIDPTLLFAGFDLAGALAGLASGLLTFRMQLNERAAIRSSITCDRALLSFSRSMHTAFASFALAHFARLCFLISLTIEFASPTQIVRWWPVLDLSTMRREII